MEIVIARAESELAEAYERLRGAEALGCDTETSGFNSRVGKLFSIQFSDGDLGVLIPLSEGVGFGPFADVLQDESVAKIFHNARFDLEFLTAAGIEVRGLFDTMVAEKVLTRGANQSASLAETLYRYFAIDLDKSQRAKFNRNWDGVWTPELVSYALADVFHLPALRREQINWLVKLGLSAEFDVAMERAVAG